MIYLTLFSVKKYIFLCICLLAGCFIIFFTSNSVLANSYDVTATVPAPLPTQPAIITSPSAQQRVTTRNVRIQGTCSSDTAYVTLYRANEFAGTAICNAEVFDIPVTLLPEANILQTKALSSTGGEGPAAPSIVLYYDPPLPTASIEVPLVTLLPAPAQPSLKPTPSPLFITSDQTYTKHKTGEHSSWTLNIQGGISPYTITIEWGDGSSTTKSTDAATIDLEHTYTKPNHYQILIRASDSTGVQASLQLIAVVTGDQIKTLPNDTSPPSQQLPSWVAPVATSVAVTSVVAAPLFFGRRIIIRIIRFIFKL